MTHIDSSTLDDLTEGDVIQFEIREPFSLHISTHKVGKHIDIFFLIGDNTAIRKLKLINLKPLVVIGPKEKMISYVKEIYKICDIFRDKNSPRIKL